MIIEFLKCLNILHWTTCGTEAY